MFVAWYEDDIPHNQDFQLDPNPIFNYLEINLF